jgi:hypothetical protein
MVDRLALDEVSDLLDSESGESVGDMSHSDPL